MKYIQKQVVFRGHWNNQLVEIIDNGDERSLYFAGTVLQSAMSRTDPHRLVLSYTRYMMAPLLFNEHLERVLVVGIGAGSLLRFINRHFPACRIDGVDNSSRIISLARGYFQLPATSEIEIHCRDGHDFLASLPEKQGYDLILIDAFDAYGMSESVYRQDFFDLCRLHMRESGTISCNLWSGNKARMEEVQEAIAASFETSLILPVPNRGNVICLAGEPATTRFLLQQSLKDVDRLSYRYRINFRSIFRECCKNNMTLTQRVSSFLTSNTARFTG